MQLIMTEIKRLFDIPNYQLEKYNLKKLSLQSTTVNGYPLLRKNILAKPMLLVVDYCD